MNFSQFSITLSTFEMLRQTIKVKLKCHYLYWITLSASYGILPRGQIRAPPHGSSVATGGNQSTWQKPAMLGKVKLDNTLLTCDQGNFHQITAGRQNQTPVTVVRDMCTTTVPPATLSGQALFGTSRFIPRKSNYIKKLSNSSITLAVG